ncbi:MAG: hypothetical protein ACI9FN_001899 [Saprospiraceae bacterium]|jgi:hypothetical protein
MILSSVIAQTVDDLLRLSQNQYINSARSAGVGGAFGSLGADISVANINPAGIAEFRKSEIVLGGNYVNNSSDASLGGNTLSGSDQKLQLATAAGVFTSNPVDFDVKTMNIALGMNQLASFHDFFQYEGTTAGTRVERFRELAQGRRLDELGFFEAGPALDANVLLETDVPGEYYSDFVTFDEIVSRSESVERTGSINELFITVASNIKNKFSWGATLGIPIVSYSEVKRYEEVDDADNVEFFNSMVYNQSLDLSGAGVNIKAGLIYKITPKLRLGIALHSPTVYAITDNYRTDIDYNYTDDGTTTTGIGTSGESIPFDYQATTPWRALAGVSTLYKVGDLRGFVSADAEYVNYNSVSYSLSPEGNLSDEAYLEEVTQEAKAVAASAINFRLGTEIAYKFLRVRVGGTMQGSPYKNTATLNPDLGYSAGIGIRANSIYLDAAYSYRSINRDYSPYTLSNPQFEQVIDNKSSFGTLSVTVGFKI